MQSRSSQSFEAVHRWLRTPLGEALLQHEARIVEEACDGIFGEHCLQLGLWGQPGEFLRFSRAQRSASLADPDNIVGGKMPDAVGRLYRLPIATDSIDAVILPHTLEFSSRPHAILREVQRVLRSDGHVVVLGFRPGGMWGLRRLLPGAGLPPAVETLISERRLTDWLQLLDLRIHRQVRYFFRWPLPGHKRPSSPVWERRGQRWWPEFAACYMLTAQKRLVALTPVRKPWLSRPKVVGGLVKPTPRVIHVRFDKNH
ncbi:MAG: class I SAM-dependent methyltransferase [Woeseiaceae bacterium]